MYDVQFLINTILSYICIKREYQLKYLSMEIK